MVCKDGVTIKKRKTRKRKKSYWYVIKRIENNIISHAILLKSVANKILRSQFWGKRYFNSL